MLKYKNAYVIHKITYSGFLYTTLDGYLREKNIKKVYIAGILTNICVFIMAIETQMRGYETFVYRDSVAALTQEANDRALEELEKVFKVNIL
ncbi:Peroxyureidoacrylate/ureidoacrylate amidohydrolase RutB [subsurface metagenome]